jgi:hypothetical protein
MRMRAKHRTHIAAANVPYAKLARMTVQDHDQGGRGFSLETIRERARVLNRVDREVDATLELRDFDESCYPEWHEATERWKVALAAMYPPELEEAIKQLTGDGNAPAGALEMILIFLEADPWCFRSGYVKQELLRRLARQRLPLDQEERLTDVLLRNIDAGDRRELSQACKTARCHPTPRLRAQLKRRLASPDPDIARRSLLMLSSIRRPRLASDELAHARRAILDGIRYGHGGRLAQPDWLARLARRYWTADWTDPLVQLAAENRHRLTAGALISYVPSAQRDELWLAFQRNGNAAGS